jgi:dTMP kinase
MFITFEGTEGCGKSTLIRHLSVKLKELDIPHLVTREPGGSSVAEHIRSLILNQEMQPLTELFLYEAARAEHFETTVLPALRKGIWVLCDRFTDSTIAYQGFARGLELPLIEKLNLMATQRKKPDLTFFLDLPVEIGLARAEDPNKFEKAGIEFQKKVRKGFLYCIKKNPKRFHVLKVNHQSAEQVCEAALKVMKKGMKKPR